MPADWKLLSVSIDGASEANEPRPYCCVAWKHFCEIVTGIVDLHTKPESSARLLLLFRSECEKAKKERSKHVNDDVARGEKSRSERQVVYKVGNETVWASLDNDEAEISQNVWRKLDDSLLITIRDTAQALSLSARSVAAREERFKIPIAFLRDSRQQ